MGAILGAMRRPLLALVLAIAAEPALLDAVSPKPGDRVKLAVRQQDDQLVLLRIERLP